MNRSQASQMLRIDCPISADQAGGESGQAVTYTVMVSDIPEMVVAVLGMAAFWAFLYVRWSKSLKTNSQEMKMKKVCGRNGVKFCASVFKVILFLPFCAPLLIWPLPSKNSVLEDTLWGRVARPALYILFGVDCTHLSGVYL